MGYTQKFHCHVAVHLGSRVVFSRACWCSASSRSACISHLRARCLVQFPSSRVVVWVVSR
tara:strand:+ start:209 stop:388 length:180 start_codon:yes stop_codon:yes gene_type:complete